MNKLLLTVIFLLLFAIVKHFDVRIDPISLVLIVVSLLVVVIRITIDYYGDIKKKINDYRNR